MFKRTLLYSFSFLVPYFFVKKFFPENSELEKLESEAKKDLRGEANISINLWNRFLGLIKKDSALKSGLGSAIFVMILTEFNETIASSLIECSPPILAAPGDIRKNIFFSKKIQNILQSSDISELKELLLNQNLTNEDKLKLFMIKVKACLKDLRGKKRITFLLFLASLIFFLVGNYTPLFTLLMGTIRELLNEIPLPEYIYEYLIGLYREFNAPLPEDLMSKVKD